MTVTNIPMMNPEIVTGISMMLLFVFAGVMFNKRDVLGFWTILIAHVTFQLPYVILSVLPKLRQTDNKIYEAAQDLGCNKWYCLRKVIFPLSVPGIASGVTMVFVPCVSTFYITQKLGGGQITLIGDVIEGQFQTAYNYNLGAALSLVLMVMILICLGVLNYFADSDDDGGVLI